MAVAQLAAGMPVMPRAARALAREPLAAAVPLATAAAPEA
jgi:hypothetical protein